MVTTKQNQIFNRVEDQIILLINALSSSDVANQNG
jgi:hypothetical protein